MKRQSIQEYFYERSNQNFANQRLNGFLEHSDINKLKRYYISLRNCNTTITEFVMNCDLEQMIGMPCLEVIAYLDNAIARGY